jgi:UDP-2,3-diacylglucosamine pyrophosphatase LpxH
VIIIYSRVGKHQYTMKFRVKTYITPYNLINNYSRPHYYCRVYDLMYGEQFCQSVATLTNIVVEVRRIWLKQILRNNSKDKFQVLILCVYQNGPENLLKIQVEFYTENLISARFEVLSAVFLSIPVIRVVTLCR